MNQSKISVRYAKALFEYAQENKILTETEQDIEQLSVICKQPDFREFLNSPIIPISKKQELIKKMFAKKVSPHVLNFLVILTASRREAYLEMITLNFHKMYLTSQGIKEVTLISATDVSGKVNKKIEKILSEALDSKIKISYQTDEAIIGGFKLNVDDKQLDASIKTRLNEIKQQLTN